MARHSSAILLTSNLDDEAPVIAALDELAKFVEFAQLDGKALYELFLNEGLLRDLSRR
jgi:Cdc6-like AAA superfamily ATPase